MAADDRSCRDWLEAFRRGHGRPLRVLHVGNIANNAYNNAKLLATLGVDGDVLCYDYYHIMGCPEWEDADFDGDVGDQFFPDWSGVDLGGFRRPRWFAQGPLLPCLWYLEARRSGRSVTAAICWRVLSAGLSVPGGPGVRTVIRRTWRALGHGLRRVSTSPGAPIAERFDERVGELVRSFRERFPQRPDALAAADLEPYRQVAPLFARLFAHYDIVQGYSTDPALAMICNKRPAVAFEHGTLRAIPEETSARGRLTSLAYAWADHALVTNVDCREAAERLAPGRWTPINHPFDDEHSRAAEGWQELRAELRRRTGASWILFFPTRHDWVPGSGYADKGNDRFFRALARLRRSDGVRCGVVCCEWGADVESSKALARDLGVSDGIVWFPPMGLVRFERTVKACDYVVDQFELGAFGGVALKSMAAGRPVVSYLDPALVGPFFAEPPPLLSCRTEEEIAAVLLGLYRNPQAWEGHCREARRWVERHHRGSETACRQVELYRCLLDREAPGP